MQHCRYQGGHYTQDLVWGGETVFWHLSLWYFHRCRSCWTNMENGLEPIHGSSQGFDSFSLPFVLTTAAISEAAWSWLCKRPRDSVMLSGYSNVLGVGDWLGRLQDEHDNSDKVWSPIGVWHHMIKNDHGSLFALICSVLQVLNRQLPLATCCSSSWLEKKNKIPHILWWLPDTLKIKNSYLLSECDWNSNLHRLHC